MRKRMLELMRTPCSAAFIADVMRLPEQEVKAELDKLARRGKVKKTVIYTVKDEGEEQCTA